MELTNNILSLYSSIEDKEKFNGLVSDELKVNEVEVTNWFRTGEIPGKYKIKINNYLQKYIAHLNDVLA